jgi:hypothetical protein
MQASTTDVLKEVARREDNMAIKRKIARLKREIEKIDAFFYANTLNETDLAWTLELKRDDMLRAIVLQLHTATEDLLNIRTMNRILAARGRRSTRNYAARALWKVFHGPGSVGFDAKLNLALAIGVIDPKMKERMVELNSLRNKCSHNWRLKVLRRRGKKPAQKKPPLLIYRGEDLHKAAVLEKFGQEYTGLHLKLYLKD